MSAPSDRGSTDPAPRSGLSRALVVVTVLGLVLAVIGGVVGVLSSQLGGDDTEEQDAVVSAVTTFASVYNTYDVAQKDDYQQRMKPLLTAGYYTQFTKVTDAVFSALTSKKQKSGSPQVLSVAISDLDDDSAVALVAVNASITSGNQAAVVRRFRWQVTLNRSGNDWRVNQFDSVTPVEATAGDATTPTPSASPSAGASPSEGGQ
ncbi:hypothetical protein ASD11_11615 [Aeromicrobium sp. Root495]|uniref:hypothetical protein n=1 Tax=Aeromicrobium sp. Root495 TaxID=1736550 RepID=UPI0007021185|nr:hypothetical protein [Aeromicrobium sp. Root495]KQY60132.1 hypothetical protein ASD11_11615 [Aeromicrobium sp. Root495]